MQFSTLLCNTIFWALVGIATCTEEERLQGEENWNFTNLVVFGDSLSDSGNLASFLRPQIPDFPDRASNGKVAVEYLAKKLHIELKPSFYLTSFDPSGTNYAVTGARCIPVDEPQVDEFENPASRIPFQVNTYLSSVSDSEGVPHADPDALYIVYGGGNDILDAYRMVKAGASADDVSNHLHRAAASCADSARALIDAGARYIIQVGAPNVGDTPRITLTGERSLEDFAKALTLTFNIAMDIEMLHVEDDTGIDVVTVDTFTLIQTALSKGLQANEPCIISPFLSGIPEANPMIAPGAVPFDTCVLPKADGFVFYDEIHPTTAAHKITSREIWRSLKRTIRRNKDFPYISAGF